MAFQRVDKKKPKIVPDEELEGFCYKCADTGEKELVRVAEQLVELSSPSGGFFALYAEDIPIMVKALWAAYALAEQRKQQGRF